MTGRHHIVTARLLLFATSALLFVGCAAGEGIPPRGGPPDKTPPRVLGSVPSDGAVSISDDEVVISFDETLSTANPSDQVIVTPIPVRPPTIEVDGSDLVIRFRDELLPDRTYAVTVGSGLQDRAGNRLGTPVTVRFATGATLDSGRIAGRVAGVNSRDLYAFAWIATSGGIIEADTMRRADFIVPVADNGTFALEGLPDGSFRVAIVDDLRRDGAYDDGTDALGVGPENVLVTQSATKPELLDISVAPFPNDRAAPLLYRARAVTTVQTQLQFSEPIDTSTIRTEAFVLRASGTSYTVRDAWVPVPGEAAVALFHDKLPFPDSATITVDGLRDTTELALSDTARRATFATSERTDDAGPVGSLVGLPPSGILPNSPFFLVFNEAVTIVAADSAVVLSDTSSGAERTLSIERRAPNLFEVRHTDEEFRGDALVLRSRPTAFTDRTGNRGSVGIDTVVVVQAQPQRGTLQGKLIDSAGGDVQHIVVLRTREGERYEAIVSAGEESWEVADVPSGAYILEAFRDDNGNGRLDFGTLDPWLESERQVSFPGGIRVRPRWTTTDTLIEF